MSNSGPRSWLALGAAILATLGIIDVVAGPLLARAEWVKPMTGFALFGVGLLEGLIAIVVGLLGLARTGASSGRRGRGLALFGLVGGIALLGLGLLAARPGAGLPRINDITTNPDDPPGFSVPARELAEERLDWTYPRQFAPLQRAAYPDLESILLDVPVSDAIARAERAAEELGWTVMSVRPEAGILEAREISGLFRFVDDIIVRARPRAGGSTVDVRSKSRDGKGDLGANAARIRAFRDAITK